MGNEIAVAQASALEAAQKLMGGLKRTVNSAPQGGGAYLSFGKDGEWTFGTDRKVVDSENDIAMLDILGVQAGFVCWSDYPKETKKKNEKLGERMAPLDQPIDPANLPDHGWDWRAQQGGEFKFLEGAHTGTQVKYVTSSQGGIERFAALLSTVIERISSGSPYFYPLVAFEADFYIHPSWGKTYKPIFEIVGWADVNGNEEPEGGTLAIEHKEPVQEKEPEPKPEPAKEEVKAEETPEPDASSDEPQPRRRRRR